MSTSLQFAHINDADAFLNLAFLPIDFNLAGANVVVSGVAGKRILVYRVFWIVGDDTNITIQDGPNTNLTGALPFLANGTLALDISNIPWFQTSAGNDFILNSTAAVQVSGAIYYQQV